MKSKKGIQLGQAFGAVLALVLVAVLVVIAIYLFSVLGQSITGTTNATKYTESAAYNATTAMVTQFANYPTLIGLVGTIIFLALVIGVLVGAFAFGNKRGM
jgi:quinol-cytochrome oxidoreductase complex cytochrome b subunit